MIAAGELRVSTPVCHPTKTNGAWIKAVSLATHGRQLQEPAVESVAIAERPRTRGVAGKQQEIASRITLDRSSDFMRQINALVHGARVPLAAIGLLSLTILVLGVAMHSGGDFVTRHREVAEQRVEPTTGSKNSSVKGSNRRSSAESSEAQLEIESHATAENLRESEAAIAVRPELQSASNADMTARQAAVQQVFSGGKPQTRTKEMAEPLSNAVLHAASRDAETSVPPQRDIHNRSHSAPARAADRVDDASRQASNAILPTPKVTRVHGRRLKGLMRQKDLLPSELANRTGVPIAVISQILRSTETDVNVQIAQRLASEFGIDTSTL